MTRNFRKGEKVCVKKSIDPYLDPARYRGLCGKIVRSSKKYKNQYWIKMDARKISRTGKKIPGITTIFHKEDLRR